jgi:phosphatidylglycerophosphatase A
MQQKIQSGALATPSYEPKSYDQESVIHRLAFIFATGGGVGFAPKAPGTWGTVLGFVLVATWKFNAWPGYLVLVGTFAVLGLWATLYWSRFKSATGSKDTDCQEIVVDEILGYFAAVSLVTINWHVLVIAFMLFRAFDIWKPWPIRNLDRWGKSLPIGPLQSFMVIADDLLAGFATAFILWLFF